MSSISGVPPIQSSIPDHSAENDRVNGTELMKVSIIEPSNWAAVDAVYKAFGTSRLINLKDHQFFAKYNLNVYCASEDIFARLDKSIDIAIWFSREGHGKASTSMEFRIRGSSQPYKAVLKQNKHGKKTTTDNETVMAIVNKALKQAGRPYLEKLEAKTSAEEPKENATVSISTSSLPVQTLASAIVDPLNLPADLYNNYYGI